MSRARHAALTACLALAALVPAVRGSAAAPDRPPPVPEGKPLAPILLHYEVAAAAGGAAATVRVTTESRPGLRPLGIDFEAGPGLVVVASPATRAVGGASLSRSATVTRIDPGRERLVVRARGEWRGRIVARAIEIPIGAGAVRLPPRGTLALDPAGRAIVSMPAEERANGP